MKMGRMLTVMICERYGRRCSGLEQFSQQSACLSPIGASRARLILIIPFLALSLQLYDLKELLDLLTLTWLFFPVPGFYHFLTFSAIEFLT